MGSPVFLDLVRDLTDFGQDAVARFKTLPFTGDLDAEVRETFFSPGVVLASGALQSAAHAKTSVR